MLFAEGDISWAAFALSVGGSVVAVLTLFINRRFDGKFLLQGQKIEYLEAAQRRCEEDAAKKDVEIVQLRQSIDTMHQRNNVAALDRNAIRTDLDTVKTAVARHDSQVLPAVEEVKQVAQNLHDTLSGTKLTAALGAVPDKIAAKVVERLKEGGT